ncbi:MAG TPA: IS4 family transposase [Pyrinomonadaceae bacterium]
MTKGLLPTQQATISQVVCGLLLCGSLLEAEIARCFETSVEFVHNLKRVFRFVDNERINEEENKEVVARRMMAQLRRRLHLQSYEYLEVIIDWTSVGRYQVLSALIPVEGRAVPVLQWAVEKWQFKVSQNATEEQFIQSLRRCIPKSWKTVLVADRGFRRTDLLRLIAALGFSYVIRLKADVWIECAEYGGKLGDYRLSVGQTFKLKDVLLHKTKRYSIKLVCNCARIEGKVSSWLLATNLPLTARQIVEIYRRRFWCEESFRDQKQEFELEGVRVKQARRLENLLIALALVLLILAVIGMRGKKLGYAAKFCVAKKKQTVISWVQIALHLLRESTKHLNLLFDNAAACFSLHWA